MAGDRPSAWPTASLSHATAAPTSLWYSRSPQAALPHRGPTSPDPTPGKTVLANLLNRLVPSLLASMPSSQLESENRRAGNPSRDSNSNRSTLRHVHVSGDRAAAVESVTCRTVLACPGKGNARAAGPWRASGLQAPVRDILRLQGLARGEVEAAGVGAVADLGVAGGGDEDRPVAAVVAQRHPAGEVAIFALLRRRHHLAAAIAVVADRPHQPEPLHRRIERPQPLVVRIGDRDAGRVRRRRLAAAGERAPTRGEGGGEGRGERRASTHWAFARAGPSASRRSAALITCALPLPVRTIV